MAVTIIPLGIQGHALRIIRDADCNETLEANVNDGAATIYSVTVDNTANAAITYLKFWNAATATVGTTDPDLELMVPVSATRTYNFKSGLAFATGLSYAAVTTAGTAGTTGPTSDVIVNIVVG
jgi:hypothetical protein